MDGKKRIASLRDEMKKKGLEGIYITSPENFRYMSGYNNPDGFMFITLDEAYAFSDFRYYEEAKIKTFECVNVVLLNDNPMGDYLKKSGIGSLGMEYNRLTVSSFNKLKEILDELKIRAFAADDIFDSLRSVKDSFEIDSIIAAQRIAEKAFEILLGNISYDMTEIEVAAELDYQMKRLGAENPAFDTIAVSGISSSVPHGVPSDVKLRKGFLTMDYGAKVNGYCSDMTRTVVIGKADEEIKRVYNTVLAAQLEAEKVICSGSDCGENDKIARDLIEAAGYGEYFGHSLGHGVGLLIHEEPYQSKRSFGKKLKPGNVVTVEPGIYLPGKYGCRIEDMMVIGEKESVVITDCPKEMIEI